MVMNTLRIEELRKLLTAVSQHGNKHLVDVETDLSQAAYLLNEAVEKLSESFLTLDQHIQAQETLLASEQVNTQLSDETKQALKTTQAAVHQQVQQVVTNLQFQDMTNQIIERSLKRVDGLKSVLEALGQHGDEADVCSLVHEQEEISDYINSLKKNLSDGSNAIAGGINHRAVDQKDMSSGSVDLF